MTKAHDEDESIAAMLAEFRTASLARAAVNQREYEAKSAWLAGRTRDLTLKLTRGAGETIANHPLQITPLISELLEISLSQGCDLTPDREGYLGQYKERTRLIGVQLHQLGGTELMEAIASAVPSYDARLLDHAWNGIGEWVS